MKKQRVNSSKKVFHIFQLVTLLGFIFCLGSIFTFIAMNMVLGDNPSIEAVYWQRLFVSKITNVLIMPGLVFIVGGAIALSLLHYGFFTNRSLSIIQTLIFLIAINSIHISILVRKVSTIAIQQYESSTTIKNYMAIKSREDMFGGINMILLLTCLILSITLKT